MRTRTEILKEYRSDNDKILEVLLDIRDLLTVPETLPVPEKQLSKPVKQPDEPITKPKRKYRKRKTGKQVRKGG